MLQTNDDRWPLWDQGFGSDKEDKKGLVKRQAGQLEKPEKRKAEQSANQKEIWPGTANVKEEVNSRSTNTGQFMKYTSIGTELLAAVLVGTLFGWAVNRMFGNRIPWAIAVGVVVGAMAGFLNLYRLIIEEEQKEKQLREYRKEGQDKHASSR